MDQLLAGNVSQEFKEEWDAMFYDGGVWGVRTSAAHVAGVYSTDMKYLYGEYHELKGEFGKEEMVYNKDYYPVLLKGETEESKKYLNDLFERDGWANMLNSYGDDPAFLVSMTTILDDNETEVGYFLWAGEMRRAIQDLADRKKIINNNNKNIYYNIIHQKYEFGID